MLTILVSAVKEDVITADGRNMCVYRTLVKEGENYRSLQSCPDLSHVQDVEMFGTLRFPRVLALRLNISPSIKKAILEFFRSYHATENRLFDCYSFACLVSGLDWTHGQEHWKKYWEVQPYRRWHRIGDIVFLINEKEKLFNHAAVYIGWGRYLSVYGSGGDLEVATLRDMQRDYGSPDTVLVAPRVLS